ncbi:concanavalin A-like lectin/glucanases superfamily [Bellilinea caldifistulae]|uniref:LamG domain-containing protein n=1 Tax=Bellilinea caldifistulae TaxID=360411 RepID=UPI0007848E5D|nr:LamG domain-containing protein [Bellilinea caldifistulae]GAP11616.1 concanavalin A-like lectin/glucanases superfamily [Bellilinea caldifistulae]
MFNSSRYRLFFSGLMLMLIIGLMAVGFTPRLAVRAEGLAGFALSFDGRDDMVNLGSTVSMFPNDGWVYTKTVSLWVKPEGVADCSVINGIPRIEPAQCDNIFGDFARWWGISRGPTQIWVWMACFDPANPSTYPPYSPIRQIQFGYTLDEWMHIALVHGNGYLSAYKNGNLVGSVNCIGTAQPPAQPVLYFGGMIKADSQNQNHSFWGFQGQIDELRIYSTALSQQEIQDTMMSELTGAEAGLVAYYKMSNGEGLTLTDDSGHGKTGQLMDGTNIVPGNGTPPLWVISGALDNPPPTLSPTVTGTMTSTPSASPLPPTATSILTESPTPAGSLTPTSAVATNTPTRTPPPTRTPRPTFTASPTSLPPTITPTRTPPPTRTPRPTFTASPTSLPPTITPTRTPRPTRTPWPTFTASPTRTPTQIPIETETFTPTSLPTFTPSPLPVVTDTVVPTETQTTSP